jgi:hypothetical protein
MAEKPLPHAPSNKPSLSSRDMMARSLSPLIAVASSPDADDICRANNIASFADFIGPFGDTIDGRSKLLPVLCTDDDDKHRLMILTLRLFFSNQVVTRDSQGMAIPIDNFNVRFQSIDKLDEPDHQAIQQLLNDTVKANGTASTTGIDRFAIKKRSDVTDSYLDSK